jgi:hypothetical protein
MILSLLADGYGGGGQGIWIAESCKRLDFELVTDTDDAGG